MTSKTQRSATGKPTITEIGIFPFKTYGSLIKRELKWFEDQSNQRIKSILPLYKLAKKIAVDDQVTEDEALVIVQSLEDPKYVKYTFKYLEDLGEIQKNNYSKSDFNADICTMFIQSRIPSSKLVSITQDLFDYYDIQFDPEIGWTEFYTESLPEDLIDEITEFVMLEKSKLTSDDSKADTEVTLGK